MNFEEIRQSVRVSGSTMLQRTASLINVIQYCKPEILVAFMSQLSHSDLLGLQTTSNPYVMTAINIMTRSPDDQTPLQISPDLDIAIVSHDRCGKWFVINCSHEGLKRKHERSPYYGSRLFAEMIRDGISMQ